MDSIYICVANGYNKENKPYSRYSKIVSIVKNGKQLQFLDSNSPVYVESIDKIGSIKKVSYTLSSV
jgi:hypothetical protein